MAGCHYLIIHHISHFLATFLAVLGAAFLAATVFLAPLVAFLATFLATTLRGVVWAESDPWTVVAAVVAVLFAPATFLVPVDFLVILFDAPPAFLVTLLGAVFLTAACLAIQIQSIFFSYKKVIFVLSTL